MIWYHAVIDWFTLNDYDNNIMFINISLSLDNVGALILGSVASQFNLDWFELMVLSHYIIILKKNPFYLKQSSCKTKNQTEIGIIKRITVRAVSWD